jgi:F420-dependent oxidoreductase-like protein
MGLTASEPFMRIGLTALGPTVDKVIEQATTAERDGFASLWFASGVCGDPLSAMAVAGRATTRIELGTAVLQTYPVHPLVQAARAAATAAAMGRPGFTLGIGPSHEHVISDKLGLSYANPGRNTEEYVSILSGLLVGQTVTFDGQDWAVHDGAVPVAQPVPVLLAALGPRLLRVAGEHTDGVVLWMAAERAIELHIAPRLRAAARDAGRVDPRIVAGLPVAVHDDLDEARRAVMETAASYDGLTNYRRILELGGADSPADVAIVGSEAAVTERLRALVDVGVTDIQAFPVGVGEDRRRSRQRTTDLLASLCT